MPAKTNVDVKETSTEAQSESKISEMQCEEFTVKYLNGCSEELILICVYSFGDDHHVSFPLGTVRGAQLLRRLAAMVHLFVELMVKPPLTCA